VENKTQVNKIPLCSLLSALENGEIWECDVEWASVCKDHQNGSKAEATDYRHPSITCEVIVCSSFKTFNVKYKEHGERYEK
jgi:hypothetical protein